MGSQKRTKVTLKGEVDDLHPGACVPYFKKFQKMQFQIFRKIEMKIFMYIPCQTFVCADFGIKKRPYVTYT
jgi:hypothetical protein